MSLTNDIVMNAITSFLYGKELAVLRKTNKKYRKFIDDHLDFEGYVESQKKKFEQRWVFIVQPNFGFPYIPDNKVWVIKKKSYKQQQMMCDWMNEKMGVKWSQPFNKSTYELSPIIFNDPEIAEEQREKHKDKRMIIFRKIAYKKFVKGIQYFTKNIHVSSEDDIRVPNNLNSNFGYIIYGEGNKVFPIYKTIAVYCSLWELYYMGGSRKMFKLEDE